MQTITPEIQKELDRLETYPLKGYYTFLHHTVIAEQTNNLVERIEYILTNKPSNEVLIRLRHIRPISNELYQAYKEARSLAGEAFNKTRSLAEKTHNKDLISAWTVYKEALALAGEAYEEVLALAEKPIRALIPDCQWDGRTILGDQLKGSNKL